MYGLNNRDRYLKVLLHQRVFATMLMGLKINADDVTPSYGLFLPYRGEKYLHYYIYNNIQ
jgi:hypothetical protein